MVDPPWVVEKTGLSNCRCWFGLKIVSHLDARPIFRLPARFGGATIVVDMVFSKRRAILSVPSFFLHMTDFKPNLKI
jgi:hypothetical protein